MGAVSGLATLARGPRRDRGRGELARHLVFRVLLISALLSLVASGAQLFASYKSGRASILSGFDAIEASFRDGLETAIWEGNPAVLDALLNGVLNKSAVTSLRLMPEVGQPRQWNDGAGIWQSRTLVLYQPGLAADAPPIGRLEIGLTQDHLLIRLRAQLWSILLSNLAKTLCAAVILLALFEQLVVRHLNAIAAQLQDHSWEEDARPIVLDRPSGHEGDDIDQIVELINQAKQQTSVAFTKLRQEIVQRREAENALGDRTDSLDAATTELAQFTYAISHDLSAPTHSLRMLITDLAETEGEGWSDQGKAILRDVDRTLLRMQAVVEDVLAFARTVESTPDFEAVPLGPLLHDVVEDFADSGCRADVSHTDLPVLFGARSQLRLLLENLVGNAIKFRKSGQTAAIHVAWSPVNRELRVEDQGIGIAPEHHQRIFGLFQRLHAYHEYEGNGLGLPLCRRIAENHKARIRLASMPGQGCSFVISFPQECVWNSV